MLFLNLPPLAVSLELLSLTPCILPLYREPLSAMAQSPRGVTAQLRLCTARHTEGIVSTGEKALGSSRESPGWAVLRDTRDGSRDLCSVRWRELYQGNDRRIAPFSPSVYRQTTEGNSRARSAWTCIPPGSRKKAILPAWALPTSLICSSALVLSPMSC